MPLYDFKCNKCGHITTFLEKPDSKTQHICEKCKSADTSRVFSSFQVQEKESSSTSSSTCTTGTCPFN